MDIYDRLIDLLSNLVADGQLTEEQAAGILINWQTIAGLETILPLPPAAGIAEEPDDDGAAVLAILLAVLGARAAGARRTADVLARLAPRYRRPVIDMIQDHHAEQAATLADDLIAGRITVSEWQAAARRLNQSAIRAMAELGAGANYSRFAEAIRQMQIEQAAYLQRFTEQIAMDRIARQFPELFAGRPQMSFEQIAARLAMYSGPGRSAFFTGYEAGEAAPGWIARYIARDDDHTCQPCSDAAAGSPYLPGAGPMPGSVCLGGGRCRCYRTLEYNPAEYARLTGIATPPAP